MSYSIYQSLNYLEDLQVVAGTEAEMTFDIYDEYGAEINLAPYTIVWLAKPYGKSLHSVFGNDYMTSSSVTKDGAITNRVSIKFTASPTARTWLHQIVLNDGTTVSRPVQGVIITTPNRRT